MAVDGCEGNEDQGVAPAPAAGSHAGPCSGATSAPEVPASPPAMVYSGEAVGAGEAVGGEEAPRV
eukprot:13555359-Alexandrium_andersonii.AAC.1